MLHLSVYVTWAYLICLAVCLLSVLICVHVSHAVVDVHLKRALSPGVGQTQHIAQHLSSVALNHMRLQVECLIFMHTCSNLFCFALCFIFAGAAKAAQAAVEALGAQKVAKTAQVLH